MYVDAHLHSADYSDCCTEAGIPEQIPPAAALCCSAHDHTEYERHRLFQQHSVCSSFDQYSKTNYTGNQTIAQTGATTEYSTAPFQTEIYDDHWSYAEKSAVALNPAPILFSFGIHPQNPVTEEADFLYHLLETKQIQAIGECGFDLFNAAYQQTLPAQQKVWQLQVQWAYKFQVPIVIHCRKALPLLFAETAQLKKLPAVIFHGWGGSPQEAESFLKKGVNAYFSIGKAVLRGQKSVCKMAAAFDIDRLLTETDAPYMRLKRETFSHPSDIIAVTAQCANLRKKGFDALQQTEGIQQYESSAAALADISCDSDTVKAFTDRIAHNFQRAFMLSGTAKHYISVFRGSRS